MLYRCDRNSPGSGYVLLHHVMGGVEGKQGAWAYPEGGKTLCFSYNASQILIKSILYSFKGMGGVSNALANSAIEKGTTIFTEQVSTLSRNFAYLNIWLLIFYRQEVREIMVGDKGKVEGVKLRDGTEIFSKVVLSNATPHVTFLNMLPPKRLPEAYLKKIRSVDYSSPVTKINGTPYDIVI